MHCLEQLECLNLADLDFPSLKLGTYFSMLNQTTYYVIKVCMHGLFEKQTCKAIFSCSIVIVIYYCKNDEIDNRKGVNILTVSQSTNQGGITLYCDFSHLLTISISFGHLENVKIEDCSHQRYLTSHKISNHIMLLHQKT